MYPFDNKKQVDTRWTILGIVYIVAWFVAYVFMFGGYFW